MPFTKITGYEKGSCTKIEYCKPSYGYSRRHGYRGRRSPRRVKCKKEKKEVCKQVPVKEEVTKEVEKCTRIPKEACDEREIKVPKITCEEEKHNPESENEEEEADEKIFLTNELR